MVVKEGALSGNSSSDKRGLYVIAGVSGPDNAREQLTVLYDPDKGWLTAGYVDADGVNTTLGDVISPLPAVVAS